MSAIGEKLRDARVEQALTLDEVSASTRINLRYLQALETGDRSAFPAGFFYKSFVSQYAHRLGLDDPGLLAEVDCLLAADTPLPLPGKVPEPGLMKIAPMPGPGSGGLLWDRKLIGSLASFVLVLAACSGIYTWWSDGHMAAVFAGAPQGVRAAVTVLRPAPPPRSVGSTLPEAAPRRPAPAATVSLNIAANETTWLSVSSDGKPVFSGLLEANHSKALAAGEHAKLVVGNAGGLSVEWNGRQIGPLGRRGQVRVVTFTRDGYKFLDSTGKPPPNGAEPGTTE